MYNFLKYLTYMSIVENDGMCPKISVAFIDFDAQNFLEVYRTSKNFNFVP